MTDPAHPTPSGDGRGETPNERSDRNWDEILQELRVTQTGTQIISGFLLAIVFQQRFSELNGFQVTVYLVLVVLAASATAVGLAPVSLHRTLFRRHEKEWMVMVGNRLLKVTLLLVALLTAGVVLFIFDVVAGLLAGIIAGTAIFVLLVVVLVVLPRSARHHTPTQ
ncbi:DUF6328 family protein [Leifsonia kafniensis]|uniref:DUF6328 family protein n=1 Tax=Leifsonia kafniensis TaxID=475957 RepID=A0ABP7KHJ8_9MICO